MSRYGEFQIEAEQEEFDEYQELKGKKLDEILSEIQSKIEELVHEIKQSVDHNVEDSNEIDLDDLVNEVNELISQRREVHEELDMLNELRKKYEKDGKFLDEENEY